MLHTALGNNPLWKLDPFPAFGQIRAEHIAPVISQRLEEAQTALDQVCAPGFPANWQAISQTLEVALEQLARAWGVVSHLNSVADNPTWRSAYNEQLPKISAFYAQLGANESLYAKYRAIEASALSPVQKRALDIALRDARLNGAELDAEKKQRFIANQEKLSTLAQKFHENSMDASDAYAYYAQLDELEGVPDDVVRAAQQAAQKSDNPEHHTLYKLGLKLPIYLPVMQYAHSRALREKLYLAYVSRASEIGEPAQYDNTDIMRETIALRQEQAALLGFEDYAHASLASKMADNPSQVLAFLRELADCARAFALRDVEEMRQYAATHLGIEDPQAWDWTYIAERLKESKYSYSEHEVKQYFTLPRVLEGLFSLAERFFDVQFKEQSGATWHPDVRFYEVLRQGQTVAHFYLDPTARAGKQNGAWMDGARSRWLRPDTQQLQTPIAYLVCNYAAGQDSKPALLTHDDIITLFHEMGHGLHHMLSQVDELSLTGISGVEWDAVELPSQFMENFCWEWETLSSMSAHVDTGLALPRSLFDKMVAAKNFQSGLATLRQVEFAVFDMLLHSDGQFASARSNAPRQFDSILDLQRAVNRDIHVLTQHEMNRSANTFGHIFSGGYAAGYYSYKWAEVLSADAYSAFEEAKAQGEARSQTEGQQALRKTALAFLHEILEVGASRPAMESFIAFRKRAPRIEALLRHHGMQA